ncbi:GNAT family N-acetyltransferase [Actinokineospora auranticolor]|uniref:Peptidoglycan biosynthesis/recognition protein n=1 Tax=Actinokineospora auranticolor TaxID=155976 RepID=A0A2S6GPQ6_9PSEU|nr:GNAT family N-acetyltransferase [Actinokineospora auranticolor]PPK67177.1 peptidoglycan biosynthesis/recognition protein [Actinokineospora auranticolor]
MTAAAPRGDTRFDITECDPRETPAQWDAMVPDTGIGFYSSRSWNLAMRGQNGARESAVVVRACGELRAVVPVYRYTSGPANAHLHPGALFGGVGVDDPAARRWEPVTVVGSASGYGTAPAGTGDLAGWAAAVARVADAARGTVVVPHLTEADVARVRHHLPDLPVLLTAVRVHVPLPRATEAEYEALLRPRTRELVRRERRLLARGGRVVRVEPITEDNVVELARLQTNTQRRHGSYGDVALFVDRYRRIRSVFGDALLAFVCRHEDQAVGFMSCVARGTALIGRSVGLDYARVGRHAEYFNLMVHEPVRYGLRHGARHLDLGVAGYEQKLRRGGVPVPVWSVLLRPPPGWSAAREVAHNRATARSLLGELGEQCPPEVAADLARVVDRGTVGR